MEILDVHEKALGDGARLMIEAEYLIFHDFAWHQRDGDYELEVTSIMSYTQRGRYFVRSGIDGYTRLNDLPKLRAFQADRKLLDVPRLAAIDRILWLLPPETSAANWNVIDEALVKMFARVKPGRQLPSPWSIRRRLKRLITTIDATVNFDEAKRKRREEGTARPAPSATFWGEEEFGGLAGMALHADDVTIACVRAAITETARAQKIGAGEAIIALLTGELAPKVRPVLNIYAVGGAAPSVYLPGLGWTGARATAALAELFETCPPEIVNLAKVKNSRVDGYSPTQKMRDYIQARDGTCIYPGCNHPAEKCQLDHRIPYDQGGKTTPDNLFSLCQRHHNVKTDRRGFYVRDDVTGEIIWLFADGRWVATEDNGIFDDYTTPTNPRWSATLDQVRTRRSRVSRFNAKCHAVCDTYEVDGDLDTCQEEIRKLEKEYGLRFEFTPQPEDLSWLPPEPAEEEHYYSDTEPDPEDYEWLRQNSAA